MSELELWIGRPRSPKIPLWILAVVVVLILGSIVAESAGLWLFPWWSSLLGILFPFAFFAAVAAGALYTVIATGILLSALAYFVFAGIEARLGIGFWSFTAITTIAGAVVTMRALRVAKCYRDGCR